MGRRGAALVLVWVVALACIFLWLGSLPLLNPDEGRNASVAREMKDARSFVVPLYNGMAYLDKPALYFDLVAASLAVFGDNEAAARLPSALFGVLTLLLVFAFCRHAYGVRAAAFAVLVLGTTPLFMAFSRTVIFDIALTFFVCASLLAGFMALEPSGDRSAGGWFTLTALAASLATLVKGPVGFLLPLLGLTVYARVEKLKGGRRFFAPRNLAAFFVPVLAWFLALSWQRSDFPFYGIMRESLARFTSAEAFGRGQPFHYYAPIILAVVFPWSLLLPELSVRFWGQRGRTARADRMLALFAVVVVIFFSISRSKLAGYVLPGVVALAILLARAFDLAVRNPQGAAARTLRRGTVVMTLVCGAMAAVLVANHVVSAGSPLYVAAVHTARAQLLLPFLMIWSLATAAAALAARMSRSTWAALAAFALPVVLLVGLGIPSAAAYGEGRSSRPLARAIRSSGAEGVEVAGYQCFAPGLPFYLGRPVTVITVHGDEVPSNYIPFTLEKSPQWPPQIVRLADAQRWLSSRTQPVLMLSDDDPPDPWVKGAAEAHGAVLRELAPGWWGALIPPKAP